MIYLKIFDKNLESNNSISKSSRLIQSIQEFFFHLLSIFLPLTNPDFSSKIGKVAYWYLEFENEYSPPEREIGFYANDIPTMIMPFRNNYGYWVDNELTIDDFRNTFPSEFITNEEFDAAWENWKKINLSKL